MNPSSALSEFLRTRRAGLRPEDVDLPDYGGRRRVAGLRREELAHLAGVSVDYYTRLEQGRVGNPSDAVLDAVARALRLAPDESGHLHRLARPTARPRRRPAVRQQPRPSLLHLLRQLHDTPAVVMGHRMDVLAWNPAAVALFGDYGALPVEDRNIARITFLDPASRELYADWAACARENVAFLHLEAGRRPEDPLLAELIGRLCLGSEEFQRMWAEHPVADKTSGRKSFRHPFAGTLDLAYDTLRPADDPGQALVTYTADPGSASDDGLRLLLSWAASG